MQRLHIILTCLASVLINVHALAHDLAHAPLETSAGGVTQTWTIGGVERTAIVHRPREKPSASPVILAFHGHGGSARNVERSMHFHSEWADAVVVYPQGLLTKSARDPQGTRSGWQNRVGEFEDRDVAFVDAIMASLRAQGWVDDTRVYATGHSNGGGFTYALWCARSSMLAAVAPVAAGSIDLAKLTPLPCMHVASRGDEIVLFARQERVMTAVRRINQCETESSAWASDASKQCTLWESKVAAPFIAMITDGGHAYPAAAPALITRFFKSQSKVAKAAVSATEPIIADDAAPSIAPSQEAKPQSTSPSPPTAKRPRQNGNGNGPWNNDVGVFRVTDQTQKVTRVHSFERAGVASVARLANGELLAAFQWFPDSLAVVDGSNESAKPAVNDAFDKIALSRSTDGGASWSAPSSAIFTGLTSTEQHPFDPTLVVLDDGRIRLYITRNESHDFSRSTPSIGSAISSDGATFAIEPGVRFAVANEPVIDCAVTKLANVWHLISPKQLDSRSGPLAGKAYHATSSDGLIFTRGEDIDSKNNDRWLGAMVTVGDEMRFFGTGDRGVWSARSRDGVTWTIDATRLTIGGADPGVVILPSGEMIVVATVMKPRAQGANSRDNSPRRAINQSPPLAPR